MSAPRSGGWTTKRTPTRVSVYLKDNSYLRSRLHPRGTTHAPLATHTQRAKKRVHVTTLPASLLSPPKDKTNRRTTARIASPAPSQPYILAHSSSIFHLRPSRSLPLNPTTHRCVRAPWSSVLKHTAVPMSRTPHSTGWMQAVLHLDLPYYFKDPHSHLSYCWLRVAITRSLNERWGSGEVGWEPQRREGTSGG